ncbi:MAG: hypothetical protein LBM25_00045 [Bacteroidales bacterium]|nr:hypothetical protein [Bacteroidales bacterium]
MIFIVLIISIAVVVISYFFFNYKKNESLNKEKITLIQGKEKENEEIKKVVIPLELQAYERLTLFLDRMNPNNLVLRCYEPNMDTKLLKDVMIKNIRDEFDYNISQQIYVSSQLWAMITSAKEEMINTINIVYNNKGESITPTGFAGALFEHFAGKNNPLEMALEVLKQESKKRFLQ